MNKIVVAGMARSGTRCIAELFKKLGIDSRHQNLPGPGDWQLFPYDLDDPPPCALSCARHAAWSAPQFNASWGLSFYVYLIQQADPDLRFLIATRDPKKVCNSLNHYRRKRHRRFAPLSYYARQYAEAYHFMADQVERMDPRPQWYDAERLFAGEYTGALLALFDLPADDHNLHTVREHLRRPVNTLGRYAMEECEQLGDCHQAKKRLESVCPELPRGILNA